MDELQLIIAITFGLNLVVTGLFTWFWRWLLDVRRDGRLSRLEDAVYSLEQTLRSQKAVAARQENKEISQEGLAKLAQIWSDKDMKQEDKINASIPIAMSNPALMKEALKMFKGIV